MPLLNPGLLKSYLSEIENMDIYEPVVFTLILCVGEMCIFDYPLFYTEFVAYFDEKIQTEF